MHVHVYGVCMHACMHVCTQADTRNIACLLSPWETGYAMMTRADLCESDDHLTITSDRKVVFVLSSTRCGLTC